MAPVGTAVVAMAAKKHAVPFVVLVGMHKLSPLFPHDPDVNFNEFKSPAGIVNYDVMAEPLQNNLRSPEAEDGTVGTDESCVLSACPVAMNTSPHNIRLSISDPLVNIAGIDSMVLKSIFQDVMHKGSEGSDCTHHITNNCFTHICMIMLSSSAACRPRHAVK